MLGTEKVLKALANRRRLAILAYILKTHKATVGEIAKHLKLSLKSTSKHLSLLRAADILEREQVSLTVSYSFSTPLHPIVKTTLAAM